MKRETRVITKLERGSEVQQHMAKEVDINAIVDRFKKTGQMGSPQDIARQVVYGDFSAFDYQESLNMVTQIRSQFMTLPPKIRRRFNHDPHTMIAFVENPKNRSEAIKLGLLDMNEDEIEAADEAARKAAEDAKAKEMKMDLVVEAQKADLEANPHKKA